MTNKPLFALSLLASVAILTACGGGGSSSNDTIAQAGTVTNALSVPDSALSAGASMTATASAKAAFDTLAVHQWTVTQLSGESGATPPVVSDPNCDRADKVPGAKASGSNPGISGTSKCTVTIAVPAGTPTSDWLVQSVAKSGSAGSATASFKLSVAGRVATEGGFRLKDFTVPVAVNVGTTGFLTAEYFVNSGVTLDKPVAYEWSKESGGTVVMANANTSRLSFLANTPGDYVFRVKATAVIGGQAVVRESAVVARVQDVNSALQVSAGDLQVVKKGDIARLTGTVSNVAANGTLTYQWSGVGPGNAPVTLYNDQTLTPQFTATQTGDHEFVLKVTQSGASPIVKEARTLVNVQDVSTTPYFTVSAGTAQLVQSGSVVNLTGKVANGTPAPTNLAYTWEFVSGPAPVNLSGANSVTSSFVAPAVPGDYRLRFKAESAGVSKTDDVVVKVAGAEAKAYRASAGPVQAAVVDSTVTLQGAISGALNSDAVAVSWMQVPREGDVPVELYGNNTFSPSFFPTTPGTYVFELLITPNDGSPTQTSRTMVLVYPSTQTSPGTSYFIISAGDAQVADVNESVVLKGELAVGVPAPQNLRYEWSVAADSEKTTTTLSNVNSLTASFIPNAAGTYRFKLKACTASDECKEAVTHVSVTVPTTPAP